MTLKNETLEIMKENNKSVKDIDFICTVNRDKMPIPVYVNIKKFFEEAKDESYYDGFGGNCANLELKIVFKDGTWLERHEYDGSEWWEYKSTPIKPVIIGNIKCIWDKYFKKQLLEKRFKR